MCPMTSHEPAPQRLEETMKRLRPRRTLACLVVLGLLAASCGTDNGPAIETQAEPAASVAPGVSGSSDDTRTPGVIVRVLDGDTVDVNIAGNEERIRLIGIDTPEPIGGYRDAECFGIEASDYTKRMLPVGTRVRLERDIELRDKFDRLLGYIYREQDNLFVNLDLIESGYATDFAFEPNTTYAARFEDAANSAKALNLGLWGACGGPDRLLEN
jgi:endonuclease YncB( thermonuclease family)